MNYDLRIMNFNKKTILILLFLVLAGGFLRLWKLNKYPVGLTPDEAMQGYSAYSLLKTGKDEWGKAWPLNLRSYGDFKPPLQTYLIIPSIKAFGLSRLAVRFPNALLGTLAIIGVYLLSQQLFKSNIIGLLSAGLVAFSPWHWTLSRGAFEANMTVFFISFGLWALMKNYRVLAAVLLGLNMFSYHSAKLITPVAVLTFIIFKFLMIGDLWLRNIKQFITHNFKFIIIFTLFFLFAFSSFFTGGQSRGLDIAVFSPTDEWQVVKDSRWWAVNQQIPNWIARLIHNKGTYTFSKFFENYLSYFSPQFLFTEGAGEGTYGMIPGYGVIWWWLLPILICGLIYLVKSVGKDNTMIAVRFLLAVILFAPIPAALTKGSRMANRVAVMMPFIQMLTAWSIWKMLNFQFSIFKNKFNKFILLSFFLYSFISFLEVYFVQSPRLTAAAMLYGRCEAVEYVQKYYPQVDQIIMSRKLSEPQAYALFCGQYPPAKAQKETGDWLRYEEEGLSFVDQLGEYRLGKYLFKELNWASDSLVNGAVLIGKPEEFPYNVKPDTIIRYPNEEPAIYIIKV